MMPKGVSIGLRSSQGLCNLLLSIYLDHRLKDQEAVAHYYRYCDDGLVLSGSKKYLWKVRDIIHEQARKARLEIKSNDTVFPDHRRYRLPGICNPPGSCTVKEA